jgi:hypothetical protein
MRPATKATKPERQRPEVYPGVFARIDHGKWWFHGQTGWEFWRGRMVFEGSEDALRAAGLIRAGDQLPQKPGGMRGFATMRRTGELRLWRLDAEDAAARDSAFLRFMETVTAPSGGEE